MKNADQASRTLAIFKNYKTEGGARSFDHAHIAHSPIVRLQTKIFGKERFNFEQQFPEVNFLKSEKKAAKTMNNLLMFFNADNLSLQIPYSLEVVGNLGQRTSFPENDKLEPNMELLVLSKWEHFINCGNSVTGCVQN